MNPYTFHINFYDLAFLGVLFIGLTFALQLWVIKKANHGANRFLALAVVTLILWIARVLFIDIGLTNYFPHWSWLPLQYSLAPGPLIFFYVLKVVKPDYHFRVRDLLHFSPLLLELFALVLEVSESAGKGIATYDTSMFRQFNPVIQLLAFISAGVYLFISNKQIARYYGDIKFTGGDRYRQELQWLRNLLLGFTAIWLLSAPFGGIMYYYHLGGHANYPL